jgi:spore maturation protein CgeB
MKFLIIGREISNISTGDYINIALPLKNMGYDLYLYDMKDDTETNKKQINNITINFIPNLIIFIPVENEIELNFAKELSTKYITIAYFYDDTWRINYSLNWADAMHYVVTSDTNWKINFYHLKEKVIYAPFFINCEMYKKSEYKSKEYNISFVGQYHPYREWVINKIKNAGYDVHVFGKGWSRNSTLSFFEMVDIFNKTKINLNLSNCVNYDIRHLFNLRLYNIIGFLKAIKLVLTSFYKTDMKIYEMVKARFFEINACSSFQLGFYAQGLEQVYDIGREIEIFSSTDELLKKIKFYLENENEREKIANQGYLRTLKEHDAKSRLEIIIRSINFEKSFLKL